MLRRTSLAACAAAVAVAVAFGTPVAAQAGRLITGNDIKDGSVTTADVANGSLKKRDFAADALPEDGARGPKGDRGAEGLAGTDGARGPSGVVDTVFQAGSADPPTADLAFIAPTATVGVRTGETVSVTSSVSLGSSSGAIDLDLDVCYTNGGTPVVVPGGGVNNLTAAGGQQHLFTLSAVIDGVAGTYFVGLCGRSSDGGSWDQQGGGQTSIQVFTTP